LSRTEIRTFIGHYGGNKRELAGARLLASGFRILRTQGEVTYWHPETKIEVSFSLNTPQNKAVAVMRTALKAHKIEFDRMVEKLKRRKTKIKKKEKRTK